MSITYGEFYKWAKILGLGKGGGGSSSPASAQSSERIIAGPSLSNSASNITTTRACNTAQPIIFRGGCTRFRTEYDGRFFSGVNTAYEADLPNPIAFTGVFCYPYACFTGQISGTTLTVTVATLGQIAVGSTLSGTSTSTLTAGTTIVSQLTSTETGGALGGKGTYQVSASQTLSSQQLNAETYHSTIKFSGQPFGTLAPGVIGYASDMIDVNIPPGGVGRLRHFASVGANGQMTRGFNFNNAIFPGAQASASNSTTEVDQTANLSYGWLNPGSSYNSLFCANRVVGTSKKRTASIGFMGDSVTYGTGYTSNLGYGYLGQMLNGLFNTANHGFPGERGYFAMQQNGQFFRVRERLARQCDIINWAWASNDFHYMTGTAAQTLAQMQGTALLSWQDLIRRGCAIFVATVTPQSASTDSWISEANQTPLAAWAVGGGAQLWNAWLRDGAPLSGDMYAGFTAQPTGTPSSSTVLRIGSTGHPVTFLSDIALYCESQTKAGVWRADGGVQWSPDGVHPLQNACTAIINGVGPAYIAKAQAIEATLS